MYRFYFNSPNLTEAEEWLVETIGPKSTTDDMVKNMLVEKPARLWTYTSSRDRPSDKEHIFRFSHYQDLIHFKMMWQ